MLKLVLNIKLYLLLCFFNVVLKCILGHLQDFKKVGRFHYKNDRATHSSFQSNKTQKSKYKHFKIQHQFQDSMTCPNDMIKA